MNFELLKPGVQDYINEHLAADPVQLMLKPSPFPGLSMRELAEQIRGKQKCRQKLPLWHQTQGIYYPPSISLEQCSSSLTGAYKASLCEGETLVDLTGGAGVDSYFFSKNFREVIHIEQSAHLSAVAAHNLPLLGAGNIRFLCGDGLSWVRQQRPGSALPTQAPASPLAGSAFRDNKHRFDCIYLDPSRRTKENKKVFLPRNYEPDFIPQLNVLVSRARQVIIKTSPLVDIKFGILTFQYVQAIHVVAVRNECKEVLWILGREPDPDPPVTCVNIRPAGLNAGAAHPSGGNAGPAHPSEMPHPAEALHPARGSRPFVFHFSTEENAAPPALSEPLQYLYEPDASILKAGAFKTVGTRFGLAKLHINSHLYTSEHPVEQFPGRSFRVLKQMTVREFGQGFKGRQLHISTRNFPEQAASLLKKYAITEGGKDYAFFTTTKKNKRVVLLCARV